MGRSKSVGWVVLSLGLALVVGAAACEGGAKVEAPVEADAKAEAPTMVSLTAKVRRSPRPSSQRRSRKGVGAATWGRSTTRAPRRATGRARFAR